MKKKKTPLNPWPEPDLETWKQLYENARNFLRAAPWNHISDEDVFVVADPKTALNCYCLTMDECESDEGFQVFLGDEAFRKCLNHHQAITSEGGDPSDRSALDRIQITSLLHCMNLIFTDKDQLLPHELELLNSLDLKFPSEQWPMFRVLIPGHIPWPFNETFARLMTLCLEQCLEVLAEAKGDPEFEFNDLFEEGTLILTRIPRRITPPFQWTTKYRRSKAVTEYMEPVHQFRPALLKSLYEKPSLGGVRFDFADYPLPIPLEDTIPPRFSRLLICMDSKSRKIWFREVLPYQPDHEQVAMNKLLEFIDSLDKKPELIRVAGISDSTSLSTALFHAGLRVDLTELLPSCRHAAERIIEKFEENQELPDEIISPVNSRKSSLKLVKNS